MQKTNKAFSLIELIIVITIITILSTIGFINYVDTLKDSRNATRLSDMGNLKMSLKNHKLKNGVYPTPGSSFDINNSGRIIKQGFLDDETYTAEIVTKPTDPFSKIQYYPYSITANGLFFQIAMSIEEEDDEDTNDIGLRAFVDGDYQTVSYTILPSIIFATGTGFELQTNTNKFIVDKGTLNLPYNDIGEYINNTPSFSGIINEENISIPKFFGFYSCIELYENSKNTGSGNYQLLNSSGSVYCQACSSTGRTLSSSGSFDGKSCSN